MSRRGTDAAHAPYYIPLLTSIGLAFGACIGSFMHQRWLMPIGASLGSSIGLIIWRIKVKATNDNAEHGVHDGK